MNNHDDFDLIDEEGPGGRSRLIYWLLGIALLLIFGFMVGLAFATLNNRLSNEPDTAVATYTPTQALVIGGNTATPPPMETSTTGPDSDDATPQTPTAGPSTATAPASATPMACAIDVDPAFGGADALLGCPASPPGQIIWAAWEPFERGAMFWRSDNDQAGYFLNSGGWSHIEEGWGGQEVPSRGTPPAGLFAPERGFGYVWGSRDDIFAGLGWATDTEKGFCARIQDFENGFMLQSEAVPSCTPDNLYNHAAGGNWPGIRFLADVSGNWSGSIGSGSRSPDALPAPGETATSGPAASPTPLPAASVTAPPAQSGGVSTAADATRPREQGRFFASRAGAIALDGSFSDWSSDWIPIETVVYGDAAYSGGEDLSARAQFAWSDAGLYVALRVRDERYRPGPAGSDLWQGDSMEINIDRLLAADFDADQADGDDYQIGLAFGAEGNQLSGYRWLPYSEEGAFQPAGAVTEQREDGAQRGYNLETLLPWSLFDIDGATLPAEAALGFVLAVNDNDGDNPAQETIIATSPARSRHDNPTQWGTLILLP
ncbi:MAG: hypothetical protein H6642_03740 [Caldilineaceae bacterium]|nr:hypothetical protein [Caldilineaceae bacterium]